MTLPSNPVHSKLEYNIIPLPSPKCESVNTYGSNVDKQKYFSKVSFINLLV